MLFSVDNSEDKQIFRDYLTCTNDRFILCYMSAWRNWALFFLDIYGIHVPVLHERLPKSNLFQMANI